VINFAVNASSAAKKGGLVELFPVQPAKAFGISKAEYALTRPSLILSFNNILALFLGQSNDLAESDPIDSGARADGFQEERGRH
jgi:hypothetical protein